MNQGKLKIYLGYAAGVGKTYQMLDEAQTIKNRGIDVAIGYFEPHGRKDTIARTEGLEVIPRKKVQYRGSVFEEMDAEAIIARIRKWRWWTNFRILMFLDQCAPSGGKMYC